LAASLLTAANIAVAAAVITIAIDKGEFVLETDDPNITVQLDKAGVKIHDRGSDREYVLKVGKQRLPSGEYDIDVKELPANIEISGSTFRLKRGDTVRLTAYFQPSARERGDKSERKAEAVPRLDGRKVLKAFGPDDKPLSRDDITADQGGWRIEAKGGRTVRLYEMANPGVEDCRVLYRAQLKCEKLRGKAYLEMWCRMPDGGEYFSKDLPHTLSGTIDWSSCEAPFFLKKGEQPDLIKLNVVIEGAGTVWIKDVSLRKAPLPLGAK
jgi:hypothetical protein